MSRKWVVISQCLLCSILILVLLISPSSAPGAKAWSGDPTENTAICTALDNQYDPKIVSDGSGGAIITWEDKRSGPNYDIYAQRVDSSGTTQWIADGAAICTASNHQYNTAIVSDGSGGAIIAWEDSRSGNWDIYAQRVDSSGTTQWIADGAAICTASDGQYHPAMVSDGSGGAIIAWEDSRSGNWDIYAQRVDSSGTTQWIADGAAICTASDGQYRPAIVSDGSGGAIIAWQDSRSGNWDIYAQRVDSSGTTQWIVDGAAICTASDRQDYAAIVSDGSGGAIIAWHDGRSGIDLDIYAQRVDSSGTTQWIADGAAICTASDGQYRPAMVSDGSGGAIITWHDWRSGNEDIYAQRLDSSGTTQWIVDGAAICTASGNQRNAAMVSDGSGGAIIAWQDYRSGTNGDIYSQRVDSSGTTQWIVGGAAICTASGNQGNPAIVGDDSGGAIITWEDWRSGTGNRDIYAQRVNADGLLQQPPLEVTADFDSGSIGAVNINGNEIELTLETDELDYTYWTNFKVSNVLNEEVTFRITNAYEVNFLKETSHESQMVYSCNGDEWNRLANYDYSAGTYTLWETFPCNEVQIATFFPFSYEDMCDYVDAISSSHWATKTTLGLSAQSRDIDLLTITDDSIPIINKDVIYIIGRQHAAETASTHMLKGMIDFLVSNNSDAAEFRKNFVWYVVPMVNPDGVYLGKSRANALGNDANRDWGNNDSIEINVVRDDIIEKHNTYSIDFFIDWESQMNDVGWYHFIYSPTGNTFFNILSDWTDFDTQRPSGASSCTASSCTARGYVMNNILYDSTFVFEPSPHLASWTVDSLEQQGKKTAYAINEYFSGIPSPSETHTWTFYTAGFFPKHLPDSYTGQVVLTSLDLANIPDEVQGVWWYDGAALVYKFWVPGVGGELTTLTGQFYDYQVLVTGPCEWTIPLP